MRIFQVIKKAAAAVITGAANFEAVVKPGLTLTTVNTGTSAKQLLISGVSLDATRAILLTNLLPALAVSTVNSGAAAKPSTVPGVLLSPVITLDPGSTREVPAAKLTRIQFDVIHNRGGSVVVTSTGWATPENTIDGTNGLANGTSSNGGGSALGGTATLELSYPAQPNRANLTITQVLLSFYTASSLTLLLSTGVPSYSLDNGATFTPLTAFGPSQTIATPQVFDITAAVAGDWTKIAALRTRIFCNFAPASNLEGFSTDAIEVKVTANHTMIP